jgi:hypothetical protein
MRPFIAVNQTLGIQSAQFMTQDTASAPVERSGSEIASLIDGARHRIADAANAVHLEGLLGVHRRADGIASASPPLPVRAYVRCTTEPIRPASSGVGNGHTPQPGLARLTIRGYAAVST